MKSNKLYDENYMGARVHRGINYRRTYHPEYGGYVFQVDVRTCGFQEPYIYEREACAFIDGWLAAGGRK